MTPQLITAIVGAIAALGGRELVVGLIGWLSGRQNREKTRVRELVAERDKAEADVDKARAERDAEAAYRRMLQEHASRCRRVMLDAGIPEADIPPFPSRPSTD